MICPNCGAQTPDSSKFCIECGANLRTADTESAQDSSSEAEKEAHPAEDRDMVTTPAQTMPKGAKRRRQRRRLTGAPDAAPHSPEDVSSADSEQPHAKAIAALKAAHEQTETAQSAGDTARYEIVRRGDAAAALEAELRARAQEAEAPGASAGEDEQASAQKEEGTQSRGDTGKYAAVSHAMAQDAVVESREPGESKEELTLGPGEPHTTDAKTKAPPEPETRTGRKKRTRRISGKMWALIAVCVCAAAAVGIWLWSVNTPRARMTQALRSGDIMLACQIYDEELREQGLTANEVYYLCAAAEKIADDFDEETTDESYQGRLVLLDELNSLPYRDVQDAVASARQRVDSRHAVLERVSAATEAEQRQDYIAAIAEYEAALEDAPDDETLLAEIARLEGEFRTHALESAEEYASLGNVAQARLVLLSAMLEERFASDAELRAMLDEITNEQVQSEGMSGTARNSLDMSRLGQAAFLVQNVTDLPNASAHITAEDLMGVLTGLYEWRDYNTSAVAGTDPVLAVIRDALPERTESAQWPLRSAARPVQLLCDALFGQRAENVNLAEALGPDLFGSYKYEDGWYYFASMTVPTVSVSYADPSALPHLEDNTYRFFSDSSNTDHDRLYQMEIRPTLTSPFGFTVSAVTTLAEGSDALDEAELSSAATTAPAPVPTASATPTPEVTEAPPAESSEEEAPALNYAPEGSLTGGMVFPDSDMRILTDADLAALRSVYGGEISAALELARNEIYARRGHIFSDPAYQNYFAQYAWYSPTHSVSESEFNDFELQNLQQIIAWEAGT